MWSGEGLGVIVEDIVLDWLRLVVGELAGTELVIDQVLVALIDEEKDDEVEELVEVDKEEYDEVDDMLMAALRRPNGSAVTVGVATGSMSA